MREREGKERGGYEWEGEGGKESRNTPPSVPAYAREGITVAHSQRRTVLLRQPRRSVPLQF